MRTGISLPSLQIVIEKCKGILRAAVLLWKWKLCLLFFFTLFDFFRERGLGLCAPLKAQGVSRLQIFPFNQHPLRVHATLGVASFSTNCRPGWISFAHVLKIARMASTHWPHQHFVLFSFLPLPNNTSFITSARVIKPKICRLGPTGPWADSTSAYTMGLKVKNQWVVHAN